MSDINKMISDANTMRKKLLKDCHEFAMTYASLEKEVGNRFQDELRHNNHKLSGLEDFHQLAYICKKNLGVIKSAMNLIGKMPDLSGFEISEEDALVRELDKILKE